MVIFHSYVSLPEGSWKPGNWQFQYLSINWAFIQSWAKFLEALKTKLTRLSVKIGYPGYPQNPTLSGWWYTYQPL